ncbi:right-handed parallel beta-helix repeat-containing protein [Halobaculum marinum]|uniref:right-handed parallel beta-helix repeat-containing protein n=1 Tax=Halobaculum marinum TaxID=3031996 RepID=UPI0023E3A513|nr:right-handed parallel beta-helix repeat-containing protein [Halobaculum sp. DT55]
MVVALLAVTGGIAAFAVPAVADEHYGPEATTYVDSCGILDDSGVYVLRQDVSAVEGDCFRVTADGVTLLGAGHSVTGGNTSGSAIVADGVSDLHIEGVAVSEFWNGITLSGVEDAAFAEVRVVNATGDGIRVADSTAVDVEDGTITGAGGHGVVVVGSEQVSVAETTLADNRGNGVTVRQSFATTVHDNRITGNGGMGVRVDDAPEASTRASADGPPSWLLPMLGDAGFAGLGDVFGSAAADTTPLTISDNRISNNRYEGVFVRGTNGSVVSGNTVTGATDGIHLINSSGVTVSNNVVSGSTDDGIALAGVHDSTVAGNVASENANDGVYLIGTNNELSGNTLSDNGDDGVDLDGGSANRFVSNRAFKNADDGLYLRESDGNVVSDNSLRDNADDGFDIRGSTGNAVYNNTVCGNDNRDLQVRTGVVGNDVHDNDC